MSELIKDLCKTIDDKQGDDIVVLDFRNNSPFVDYFVICSCRNSRLARAVLNEVEEFAIKHDMEVISKDTNKDSNWLLIDIGSIVVHIFVGEERSKYNLEGLWKELIV